MWRRIHGRVAGWLGGGLVHQGKIACGIRDAGIEALKTVQCQAVSTQKIYVPRYIWAPNC